MNAIEHIHLEDGPEDGRVLAVAALKPFVPDSLKQLEEICLYADAPAPGSRWIPQLLGRYCLRGIRGGSAVFRWRPA